MKKGLRDEVVFHLSDDSIDLAFVWTETSGPPLLSNDRERNGYSSGIRSVRVQSYWSWASLLCYAVCI